MAELALTTLLADANLKAYYKLESGALTTDSKGAYTLTNNNTVGEGTGKYGVCADFGAANTNKSLTRNDALGIDGGAITLSCWLKLNAEIASSYWSIMTQGVNNTSKTFYEIYYDYNGGTRQFQFYRAKQGVGYQGPTYAITLGTSNWYHVALTYDTTNVRGYVNGVMQAGPTAASGNGSSAGTDQITLAVEAGGGGTFASILLDDVAYFNRALSDSEILTLYNDGSPGFFNLL